MGAIEPFLAPFNDKSTIVVLSKSMEKKYTHMEVFFLINWVLLKIIFKIISLLKNYQLIKITIINI